MNDKNKTKKELLAEIEKLRGAEHSYRVLVETVNEGAATLTDKGIILYSNLHLASILKIPLKTIIGMPFSRFIPKTDKLKFTALLEKGQTGNSKGKIRLKCKDGLLIPVQVSMRALDIHDTKGICLAVTNLSEQKRNEQILKSEQLSRSILEQAGEAIVVCDTNGIITHASNSTSLLCNKNPLLKPFEEVFNLHFKTVRQTNINFSIKSVLAGKSFHGIDAVLLLKSAENPDNLKNFNLLINAAPLKNQQNNIIGCVITLVNVTEHKQIEDALREREKQLSGFFNSSPAGMAIVDSNLKFVKINHALADINGLTVNAHYGKTIREVLPELAPSLEPLYQQVLSNGKPILNLEVSGETPLAPGILRHWMVSYFPILGIDKKPKSVGAVIVEITDRQKAEEALKINMERFQQLVENIHEVFYIYSPDWKRIEYISPLYESLWGRTCNSLYEQPLSFIDCIHPDDREQIIKARQKTETKGIRSEAEYRIIRPDDTTRWIHDRNFIVYDITGKPSRIVGIAEDITERKLSEQHMSLQYNITKIISESANIDEAISKVIQVICEKTEWDLGAFWVHDKINNQLHCNNIWHKPSVNVPAFLAICKRTACTPGTGFIGRIFTSSEPIWNVDIISDTYFQRRHTAKSEGINSAFGFPIKIESEKIGVLEFFSKQARNPDDG
ncbi:MAG TPA: PAS domain S-box protein, partial [Candidatus Wujingus californicus]